MRVVCLLVLGLAIAAAPANAAFRIVDTTGTPIGGKLQRWANLVPGTGEVVVSYSNPRQLAEPLYTARGEPIYLVPEKREFVMRATFTHELGHHIDYALPEATRLFVMQHVLKRTGSWRQDTAESPHEQFAEAVSQLATGKATGGYDVWLGPRRRQLLRRVLTTPTDRPELLAEIHAAMQRRWATETDRAQAKVTTSCFPPRPHPAKTGRPC